MAEGIHRAVTALVIEIAEVPAVRHTEAPPHLALGSHCLDHDRRRQALAVPYVVDGYPAVGPRLHGFDQVPEIEDRHAVDTDDAVTGFETRGFRRTVVLHAADVGGQVRGAEGPESEAIEQHAGLRQPPRVLAHVDGRVAPPAVLGLERQRDAAGGHHLVEHCDERRFPVRRPDLAHGHDPVALLQPGLRRVGIGFDLADGRHQRRDAVNKQCPVGNDGKQEIERRPGEQYGNALPHRPLVECTPLVFLRDRPLAGVQEAHVTAERDGGNAIFGAVLAADARPDRFAEADREAQHLHAGPAPHDVVAVFVHGDEDADRDDESQQIAESATHVID